MFVNNAWMMYTAPKARQKGQPHNPARVTLIIVPEIDSFDFGIKLNANAIVIKYIPKEDGKNAY